MQVPVRVWLMILLGCLSLSARAAEPIFLNNTNQFFSPAAQLQYLVDSSNKLTLATLPEIMQWQTLKAPQLNLGYLNSPVWIHFSLQRSETLPADWYLLVQYAMLDSIDVYMTTAGTTEDIYHLALGDHLPFAQRPVIHPEFIAPLHLADTQRYDVYLRVQSTGSLQVPLTIANPEFFWQHDRYRAMFEAGGFCICLVMALYNFVLFLFLKDRSYFFYVMYILCFVVGFGTMRGWGYQFLWPGIPRLQDWALIVTTLCGAASALMFATSFMRLAQIAPRLNHVVTVSATFCSLFVFVALVIPYHAGIQLAVGCILFFSISMSVLASAVWYQTHSRQAALYCFSWILLLIGASLYMGNKFGLLPVNLITEEGLRIGALLEIVFLSLALADRVNQDRNTALAAQGKIIELHATMNTELEKQVKSRTHELEYLNQLLHQSSITDALTSTANRRHFDEVFNTEYRRAVREGMSLSLLMVDLDHFKQINDNYGHPVGDRCLQEAASVLLSVIKRPPDLVARYGGEEFAVLLPNTPLSGALSVAEQMLEKLRTMPIHLGDGKQISITASIGVAAHQPNVGDAADRLIEAADNALYAAKHAGRNRTRSA